VVESPTKARTLKSTTAAKNAGVAYVAESRRTMLFGDERVYKNVSIAVLERLSKWLLKPDRKREIGKVQIKNIDVRPPDVAWRVGAGPCSKARSCTQPAGGTIDGAGRRARYGAESDVAGSSLRAYAIGERLSFDTI
jgi:hypothetical protein